MAEQGDRPAAGRWWEGLLPRRRRGGTGPRLLLPDGTALPASFAAALLGRRERAGAQHRRLGEGRGIGEAPGRLGRAAWGAGIRPTVDSIGPRAEALLRVWLEEVDREPPRFLAAVEGADRVVFLLHGWITDGKVPPRPVHDTLGNAVSFRSLVPAGARGSRGGEALVAASVRGPELPRLRPSPTVAADGLLVPVGLTDEGVLYLPLLGPPLSVWGDRSEELLRAFCVYALARLGPEACRVLATESLRPLLEPIVSTEALDADPTAVQLLATRRHREIAETGARSFQEAALSQKSSPPVVLALLDAEIALQIMAAVGAVDLGIGLVVFGKIGESRSVSVEGDTATVHAAPGVEDIQATPAWLSADAMAEAAVVLRSAAALAPLTEPASETRHPDTDKRPPPAELEPVTAGAPTAAARRIQCLGGLRVFYRGEAVEGWRRRKALELLALLASHPEGLSRDKVLDALWPDVEPTKSGDSLRQCLRQIRERLAAPRQERVGVAEWVDERLRLHARDVWSDVGAFEAALEEARRGSDVLASLRAAVELYGGPFCDGYYFEWALVIRERLQREFLEASASLAESLGREGEYDEALRVLDRAIEEDRLAEHLYRLAMALEGKRGRPEAARARYQALKQLLSDELGVEPTQETEGALWDVGR